MYSPKVYGWNNCPEHIREFVKGIIANFQNILKDNMVGLYLHGSLAMDCFNPLVSDVDLLVAAKQKLPVEVKKAVIYYLLEIRENSSVKAVEMSIVLEDEIKNFIYPTPFELHYSEDWYERFKNGQVDYSIQRFDEDLAAHFVITKNRGICLFGKPIDEIFPEIPEEIYIRSILYDAEYIIQSPEENPMYTILNLCRILAFLNAKTIVSKKEGGEWALKIIPVRYTKTIKQALDVYSGEKAEEQFEKNELDNFVEYAKKNLDGVSQ